MLSGVGYAISCQRPENRDFCFKWGALTGCWFCRRGFVNKAVWVFLNGNMAFVALPNRPYCNAKRPLRECREGLTARKQCGKRV